MDLGSKNTSKKESKEQSIANQKFDALFGDAPSEEAEDNTNLEEMIKNSLAPPVEESNKGKRKSSGMESSDQANSRK